MSYVLDTTAFSAAMKKDDAVFKFLKNHSPGDIATVPPVIAEIEFGIERLDPSSKKCLLLKEERERLLKVITVLSWTLRHPRSSDG